MFSLVREMKSNYPNLEKCFGQFFTQLDQDYLFPLLVRWTGSEHEAIEWFNDTSIPSCGNKTPLQLCQNNQSNSFLEHIHHIEYGGFA
jgi:hypothetical protein